MDPTKTVGATEQTWNAGRTDGVKPIYPPTTLCIMTHLDKIYNTMFATPQNVNIPGKLGTLVPCVTWVPFYLHGLTH